MWEWIFDGIGTELVGLIIGAIIGGFSGYRLGIKSKSKQKQIAGDDAKQQQMYTIGDNNNDTNHKSINSKVVQSQKAGNNAVQIQTGGPLNERKETNSKSGC